MPVLWREEVKVLCSKRCGLMPLNPPALSPQWPNCIYAARRMEKKKRGNFYLLRRFSPRQNSKLNCTRFGQKMTKSNIRHLFFLFCFCHWNLSQTCLYEAERKERVRQILTGSPAERKHGDVHCWRVCVRAWVRVNGQLVNTFLGTKLFQPVLWGNVQTLCGLAKKKNLADVSVLTREWKNCPYPCVIVVPFKDVWSDRGDHHKHQLTGRAARSLSVTCVAFEISGAAAASWIISGGKIKTQRQQTWTETL